VQRNACARCQSRGYLPAHAPLRALERCVARPSRLAWVTRDAVALAPGMTLRATAERRRRRSMAGRRTTSQSQTNHQQCKRLSLSDSKYFTSKCSGRKCEMTEFCIQTDATLTPTSARSSAHQLVSLLWTFDLEKKTQLFSIAPTLSSHWHHISTNIGTTREPHDCDNFILVLRNTAVVR
jgi:hypothetical protein